MKKRGWFSEVSPRWFLVFAAGIAGVMIVLYTYSKGESVHAFKQACSTMGGVPLITRDSKVCFKTDVILSVN